MMKIPTPLQAPMQQLGFDPGDDKIVAAVHAELNMYTHDYDGLALQIWGWDSNALTDVERYKIDQVLRLFVFQEGQIVSALKRLDAEYGSYLASSPQVRAQAKQFTDSLREAKKKRDAAQGEKLAKQREGMDDLELETWRPPEEWDRSLTDRSVLYFDDPEIARNIGPVPSLAMGGRGFGGDYWRLKDNGYRRERIPDAVLYDLIDTVLAVQAEFQLQCFLIDREFTRIIETRGREFEWLKAEAARKAAEEQGGGPWGLLGDVLGVVSAVAGILALVPILTPIAGPIAVVTAVAALGAHTADAVIKGDWDGTTIVGLATDALAALPAVGAVAKSLKAGKVAMRSVGKVGVATKSAGRAFLVATGGAGASEASTMFSYVGAKGAKILRKSEIAGKIGGKVLQGSVNLVTQVPLVVEMTFGADLSAGKGAVSGAALTANYGQSIGSWGAVGTAAKKTGTLSLGLFAAVFRR
ncbi:hypothetical protein ACH4FX_11080 [Streptomyces sp. NPDC018019]|uniref:hypothetical protein n=1 Tax=Streptomyces sp. NPDC018019 TaxID=3365030 RepID=UPI00378C2913